MKIPTPAESNKIIPPSVGVACPFGVHQQKYQVPVKSFITIKIFDITGKEVVSISENKLAGVYTYTFDGTNLASGVYIYKIETGNYVDTRKMVLIK